MAIRLAFTIAVMMPSEGRRHAPAKFVQFARAIRWIHTNLANLNAERSFAVETWAVVPQNLIRANSLVISMGWRSPAVLGMPTSESFLVARRANPEPAPRCCWNRCSSRLASTSATTSAAWWAAASTLPVRQGSALCPDDAVESAAAVDMSGVIELIAGVYREYGFIFAAEEEVPSLLAFDRHYAAPDAEFFVLRHSGKVVGSIGVVRAAPGQAELRHFYVLAELRGQGLGRALIGRALRWCHDRAVADVFLWSDTRFDRASPRSASVANYRCSLRHAERGEKKEEPHPHVVLASIHAPAVIIEPRARSGARCRFPTESSLLKPTNQSDWTAIVRDALFHRNVAGMHRRHGA